MLIDFSVSNFRSIRESQRLSLTASSSKEARERHSFETGLRQAPYVLRAAAIFGANASGKTTLVRAIAFAREFILRSARDREPGEPIDVTPYLRSGESAERPSEFEIVFGFSGAVYQLGFTVDRKRVWSEWLFVTPKGKKTQRWIEREYDPKKREYSVYVNPSIPGERKTWIASTRDDALLFSTAVQLNAKAFAWPHHWLQSHLRVIRSPQRFSPSVTIDKIQNGDSKDVLAFMKGLGLDVDDFKIIEAEPLADDVAELFSPRMQEFATKNLKRLGRVLFGHRTAAGNLVYFPMEDESDGTKILFSLAGPWLDVAKKRITVIVDELHNSLHPFALKHLLDRYFTSQEKCGGQLIFTTHETVAMDEISLHRDQVWFMNRDLGGASSLTPLSDYKVRSNESYRMGYLRGRYGGLPFFPPEETRSDHEADCSDSPTDHVHS